MRTCLEKEEQYLLQLKKIFFENEIHPDEYQLERMARYADLVVKQNKTVNLISRKDEDHIIENHIFISSLISEYMPDRVSRFLDIGTGGGLPGIPLAITKPLMRGVLVDSTGKKTEAVEEFLRHSSRFVVDHSKEKYFLTFNRNGYLKCL